MVGWEECDKDRGKGSNHHKASHDLLPPQRVSISLCMVMLVAASWCHSNFVYFELCDTEYINNARIASVVAGATECS